MLDPNLKSSVKYLPVGVRHAWKKGNNASERGSNRGKSRGSFVCLLCRNGKPDFGEANDTVGVYMSALVNPPKVCRNGHFRLVAPHFNKVA